MKWRELETEQQGQLREALRNYLKSRRFAELHEGTGDPLDVLVRVKAQRLNAAPVAQLIWADKVIRDSVVIFPEDVYYYYSTKSEEFTAPSSVRVRRLRVPIQTPVTTEAISDARRQAQDLRLQAIRQGGLAEVLAAYPQYNVDNGESVTITRGGPESNTPIADRAFQLGLAQISEPIQTRNGFFLIEVQEKTRPAPAPLEDVRDTIISRLRTRFVPQQFDYTSNKELVASHATNRAWLFQFLSDDADLVRVRDFALTIGEFKRLYPEIAGAAATPNRALIRATVQEIISGEIAIQDLEERGLLFDEPFWEEAREVGYDIFKAGEYVRRRMAQIEPTEADVRDFLAKNPEQVFPSVAKVVWKYEIGPRERESLRPGELDSLQILMRSYLQNLVTLARQQLEERREVLTSASIDPETIVRNLPEPDDRRVNVQLSRLGTFNRRQAAPELAASFDELAVGEFTEPRVVRDGSVVSYYVSEEVQSTAPTETELLEMARASLRAKLVEEEVAPVLKQMEERGEIRFHPLLAQDSAGPR
jgi:hypothetical protein